METTTELQHRRAANAAVQRRRRHNESEAERAARLRAERERAQARRRARQIEQQSMINQQREENTRNDGGGGYEEEKSNHEVTGARAVVGDGLEETEDMAVEEELPPLQPGEVKLEPPCSKCGLRRFGSERRTWCCQGAFKLPPAPPAAISDLLLDDDFREHSRVYNAPLFHDFVVHLNKPSCSSLLLLTSCNTSFSQYPSSSFFPLSPCSPAIVRQHIVGSMRFRVQSGQP